MDATTIALGAAGISLVSVAVSAFTLWRSHLAPFDPLVTVGSLGLRVYPIRNEDRRWFIASYSVPIGITNVGARPGRVMGLQLVARYPRIVFEHRETFPARFEVDSAKFEAEAKNRFAWREAGVSSEWTPFLLLPRETKRQHILLEATWETPVIQEQIELRLELKTDTRDWKPAAEWRTSISPQMWSMLADGKCLVTSPKGIELSAWGNAEPEWLHQYTGPDGELLKHPPIPPSYLEFGGSPEQGSKSPKTDE